MAQIPDQIQNIPDPQYFNIEYIFYKIAHFFVALFGGDLSFSGFLDNIWKIITIVLGLIAAVFFAILFYSWLRHKEIEEQEEAKWKALIKEDMPEAPVDTKWDTIEAHAYGENQAEWRLAIIEADSILDQLLIARGFAGENLGERLKNIPAGKLSTINEAWEAHKIRNRIAHEGSNFSLSKPEARRTIEAFRAVFKELGYI